MGQITIYLDKETEKKLRTLTKTMNVSQSKYIANIIKEKLQSEWPEAVVSLAGAWEDFPSLEEIRAEGGEDAPREAF